MSVLVDEGGNYGAYRGGSWIFEKGDGRPRSGSPRAARGVRHAPPPENCEHLDSRVSDMAFPAF